MVHSGIQVQESSLWFSSFYKAEAALSEAFWPDLYDLVISNPVLTKECTSHAVVPQRQTYVPGIPVILSICMNALSWLFWGCTRSHDLNVLVPVVTLVKLRMRSTLSLRVLLMAVSGPDVNIALFNTDQVIHMCSHSVRWCMLTLLLTSYDTRHCRNRFWHHDLPSMHARM